MNTPEQEMSLAMLSRFYEAEKAYLDAGGGAFVEIAATLDPECVIYQPVSLPYGGEWRGHAGYEAWMKVFVQQWSSMEVTDSKLYPNGDIIVSKSHVYARSRVSSKPLNWPLLQFFQMRDGKILELRPFYWDTALLVQGLKS